MAESEKVAVRCLNETAAMPANVIGYVHRKRDGDGFVKNAALELEPKEFKNEISRIITSAALIAGFATIASAQQSSCADVVSAFDREDRDAARKYDAEIRTAMEMIDEGFVEQGERSVIKPLSDEGYVKIRMAAVENCRSHPSESLGRSARDMYEGVRSLQDTILGK